MTKKKLSVSPARIVLIIFGIAVFLLFTPIVSFMFNAGSIVGMAIGIVITLVGIFFEKVKEIFKKIISNKAGKIFAVAVCLVVIASLVYGAVISAKVISFMDSKSVPENTPVIVLGCKVNDTTPSVMLQKRINAAYDYLNENENSMCIVSGGQGKDENISEAQAMANSLIEKGISKDRIILENKSTTTQENLQFSKEKMEEYGLGNEAVIVTTDYHQYRVSLIAEKFALKTYSKSSKSNPFSLPTNILRECFTVLALVLDI